MHVLFNRGYDKKYFNRISGISFIDNEFYKLQVQT